ncbi:hypothetical protein ACS0TY_009263 [Phlomoides rotata]
MESHNHHLLISVLLISALTLAEFHPRQNDAQSLQANTVYEVHPRQNDAQSLQANTVYEVLRSNGLPMGLFPRGISDFSIDEATGSFRLRLQSPSPCDAVFETRLRYDRDITGRISYGKISDVTGVSAQELFLWLAVRGIQVDIPSSGLIYFDVESVSKQFSLSLFEMPKDCHFVGDVDAGEGAKNDVVSSGDDARAPISESPSDKFLRKRIIDHEKRAVS